MMLSSGFLKEFLQGTKTCQAILRTRVFIWDDSKNVSVIHEKPFRIIFLVCLIFSSTQLANAFNLAYFSHEINRINIIIHSALGGIALYTCHAAYSIASNATSVGSLFSGFAIFEKNTAKNYQVSRGKLVIQIKEFL